MEAQIWSCRKKVKGEPATDSPMWNLVKTAQVVSEKKKFKNKMTATSTAIFDLEVIPLLQCKFQLKSPNGLGGLVKNWFSR